MLLKTVRATLAGWKWSRNNNPNYYRESEIEFENFVNSLGEDENYELSFDEKCEMLRVIIKSKIHLKPYQWDIDRLIRQVLDEIPDKYQKTDKHDFVNIAVLLFNVGLLSPSNLLVCVKHQYPTLAIERLRAGNILSQDLFDFVMSRSDPSDFSSIVVTLFQTDIPLEEAKTKLIEFDTQENRYNKLPNFIDFLFENHFLNNERFNQALKYGKFFSYNVVGFLQMIERHPVFNEKFLDNLFILCNEVRNDKEFYSLLTTRYRNLWDELHNNRVVNNLGKPQKPKLNGRNSTHTASVHRTISASAIRLQDRYGNNLPPSNKVIEQILSWLDSQHFLIAINDQLKALYIKLEEPFLESNTRIDFKNSLQNIWQSLFQLMKWKHDPKILLATEVIQRIKAQPYTDPQSNVDTLKMLSLVWIAMHDASIRTAKLSDIQNRFINYLGDILIDAETETIDPICRSGTFNKIVEIMESCHPDVIIERVTKLDSSYRLIAYIKKTILDYFMENLQKANTESAYANLLRKARALKKDGIAGIWEEICVPQCKRIKEQLFEEFNSIYQTLDNPELIKLVEAGIYITTAKGVEGAIELPDFEKMIEKRQNQKAKEDLGLFQSALKINSNVENNIASQMLNFSIDFSL